MITFRHKDSGLQKTVKIGFSWTMFFFGAWVPLFRGDFKHAVLYFIILVVTLGLGCLVYPFIYNKIYMTDLLSSGFVPASVDDTAKLRALGLVW